MMKVLSTVILALACPFLFSATGCNEDRADRTGAVERIDVALDNVQAGVVEMGDEEFVEDLLEQNVQLTAILYDGTKMSTDEGLKKVAQRMLADHEALGSRLRQLANAKSFQTDNVSESDSSMQRSNNLRGHDWDVEWTDVIIDRHQKMLNRIDDYSDDTKDTEILSFINDARLKLAKHLVAAEAMSTRLKT